VSRETDTATRVVVTDINMPFWSIVRLMIKWAIAAIPAIIILSLISLLIGALITGLFGGLLTHLQDKKTVRFDDATPPARIQLV
jgi:hypothetical protein